MFFYTCLLLMGVSNTIAQKSALVLITDGSEEMDSVTIVDILRRAKVTVTLASVCGQLPVVCSHDIKVVPDTSLHDAVKKGPYDVVVLPGGLKGSQTFAENADVGALLKEQETSGRLVAANCAAPTALRAHGIGLGKRLTSYPFFKEDLNNDYEHVDEPVVVDGNLITSQGPGTAANFALKLVEMLTDPDTENSIRTELLF